MADGGWHNGLAEPLARERFQDVLSEFAGRLASAEPMRRETAVALVQQLERLGRRMAREQEIAEGRSAELDAALGALSARLEAQVGESTAREAELTLKVDRLVADLAEARAARRPLTDARAVRAILAAVAACAALCGAGAGVIVFNRPQAPKAARPLPVVVAAPAQPQPENPRPIAAAVEVVAAAKAAPLVAEPAAAPLARDSYAAVAAALSQGDASALPRLTALAGAGNASAELHLAQLYETGGAGLTPDLPAARLWTRRAAARGDKRAMYNIAQFLMAGDGGPQDLAGAATWFRRAAERGVVDAQYNLGLMYDAGRGVARNPREAVRWYARAAKAGDAGARERLAQLQQQDAPQTAAPKPAAAEPAATPDAGVRGASVNDTQAFLAQQGYYIGPIDGVVSQDLRIAADAYLRDHPIARTQ
jgi:TPR repeat protein